jgi:lipopolysaccharide export LptBFGC system permease protein LptF
LIFASSAEEAAEIQWRISPAIAIIVLGLLAIPLSHSAPKEGRGGRVLLGILAYIVYANVLYMDRSWIASGHAVFSIWWSPPDAFHRHFLAAAPGQKCGKRLMVKLVDRYLGRAVILGALLVWFGLTFLFVLISLLGELRSVQNEYTSGDAFWFVALTTPRMAYQIFPFLRCGAPRQGRRHGSVE